MGTRSVTPAEVLEQGKEKTGDSSGEDDCRTVSAFHNFSSS